MRSDLVTTFHASEQAVYARVMISAFTVQQRRFLSSEGNTLINGSFYEGDCQAPLNSDVQ
jgi:hypothetical protein